MKAPSSVSRALKLTKKINFRISIKYKSDDRNYIENYWSIWLKIKYFFIPKPFIGQFKWQIKNWVIFKTYMNKG